ncbi:hypothetical protein GCM10027037_26000 [Mucilaginibacter koreensis]
MKKLALMMALAFSVASVSSFAGDKDKGKKEEKCAPGKSCCKKMNKLSASEKAKCAKECADKEKKAA